MKILYISGPYGTIPEGYDPIHGINQNINEASRYALIAAQAGWAPLCPHKNTGGFQHVPGIPPEFWMECCLVLLSRSDAMLMIPGWETSLGCRTEHDFARRHNIPIFYSDQGIPWRGP